MVLSLASQDPGGRLGEHRGGLSNIHEDIDLTYERDDESIGSKITWSIYTLVHMHAGILFYHAESE